MPKIPHKTTGLIWVDCVPHSYFNLCLKKMIGNKNHKVKVQMDEQISAVPRGVRASF